MLVIALVCSVWAGDAQRGQAVYASNCVACHGKSGDGKGPAAQALQPPPTDFTVAEWWKGKGDEQVATMIRDGRAGTAMVAFPKLSAGELDDLIAYLKKLGVQEKPR